MELTQIITVVTIIVTWVLGLIAKKVSWFNNKMIPLQNIFVGIIVAIIEWIITKDFKVAIALSGLIAGGTYDVFHNLEKIVKGE
jgi:Na+/glutamate symporter